MSDRLKDIFFSDSFLIKLGSEIKKQYPDFDEQSFLQSFKGPQWRDKELKAKMRYVTTCLHQTLPSDFREALRILREIAPQFRSFDAMVFPDYVECYGLDHWDISLSALAFFTQFSSSEFAIRPFIQMDADKAMNIMLHWADNENEHIRRLASEGCRPRLPWAMSLPEFKKNPKLIIPVLEKLKNDDSEFVRKSVANNLNDISKDHPDVVLEIGKEWSGISKQTDWIVKHACRTLLKQGNKKTLELFGFADPTNIKVLNFKLEKRKIIIGEDLSFSFDLFVDEKNDCCIRLEYAINYVKARGKSSTKTFQIGERIYNPGKYNIQRKQSMRDMTTRKHYAGTHSIAIVVNGVEKAKQNFLLQ